MNRQGLSFAARLNAWFAAIVILLSVALFIIAYLLLYRAVGERDREVVRAQLEIYQTWYAEGGLSGLQTRFLQQEGSGKETFFVRVLRAEGAALFASIPKERGSSTSINSRICRLTRPSRSSGARSQQTIKAKDGLLRLNGCRTARCFRLAKRLKR